MTSTPRHRLRREVELLTALDFPLLPLHPNSKIPNLSACDVRSKRSGGCGWPGAEVTQERWDEILAPGSRVRVGGVGIRDDHLVCVEIEKGTTVPTWAQAHIDGKLTAVVRTNKGSVHLYFQAHPEITSTRFVGGGIEVRAGRGSQQAAVAPDRRWLVHPVKVGLAPCPDEVVALWKSKKSKATKPVRSPKTRAAPTDLNAEDDALLRRHGLHVGNVLCRFHDDHNPSAVVYHGRDNGRLLVHCYACRMTWPLPVFCGERPQLPFDTPQANAVAFAARKHYLDNTFTHVIPDAPQGSAQYDDLAVLAAIEDASRDPEGVMLAERLVAFVRHGTTATWAIDWAVAWRRRLDENDYIEKTRLDNDWEVHKPVRNAERHSCLARMWDVLKGLKKTADMLSLLHTQPPTTAYSADKAVVERVLFRLEGFRVTPSWPVSAAARAP